MRLTVNGAKHDIAAPAHETLLATLRDRLQLTGTKLVCGRGECGACTVLLDGVSVYSCLTLTAACAWQVTGGERALSRLAGPMVLADVCTTASRGRKPSWIACLVIE